jgi:hypothetical protein
MIDHVKTLMEEGFTLQLNKVAIKYEIKENE